ILPSSCKKEEWNSAFRRADSVPESGKLPAPAHDLRQIRMDGKTTRHERVFLVPEIDELAAFIGSRTNPIAPTSSPVGNSPMPQLDMRFGLIDLSPEVGSGANDAFESAQI